MLRDLIVTTLLGLSIAVFFADKLSTAVLFLLLALLYIVVGNKGHHILEKQLNYLASRVLRAIILVGAITGLFLLFGADKNQTVIYAAAILVGVLPLALPLAIRGHFALADNQKAQHNTIKIIRSTLTSNAAIIVLVILAVLGFELRNIQPVISLPQLLLVSVLLAMPLARLKADPPRGKSLKVSAHNLYAHTFSADNLPHYLKSGALASVLALLSYLLLFELNNLSPRFIESTLPLHIESTTLTALTLLLCMLANILFERQDHHEVFSFEHFTQRLGLLRMMGAALAAFIIFTSLPGLRSIFESAPLGLVEWSIAVFMTGIYIGLRRLQRYIREHSRNAVLQLHRNTK